MGFNKVYKSLLEVFPQIDARALRAVAIEHSRDADAAVEAVLVEIIPFFTERSRPSGPLTRSISVERSSEALVDAIASTQTADCPALNKVGSAEPKNSYNANSGNQNSFHDADDGHNEPFYDAYDGHREREDNAAELTLSKKINESSIEKDVDVYSHGEAFQVKDKNGVNTLQSDVSGEAITEETISDDKCPESSIKISSHNIPCHVMETLQEDIGVNRNINLIQQTEDYVQLETEFGNATNKESDQGKSCADGNNSMVGSTSLTGHDLTKSPLESSAQLVVLPDMLGSGLEKSEASLSSDTDSKIEATSNIVGTGNESTLTATLTQSSQIHIIDVLEEIIADAKTNKKTLFSAMQSVMSLMREVELKEQAAEQAKQEATTGDTDIQIKIQELKLMVQHAKEANDMHAGEVYGEKAILATELKELQSRVLSLSDERDKSLSVLHGMRQTLEVRLAAAENEIQYAELEKLEKEKAAAKALVDHELLMEKVVEESNILKQQAEDNAKLQEFLMDRGRVVDILQGEIAVICQDVSLLKEKLDKHVPFSKSLSSSETSFILASSTSSFKSVIPDQVEPLPDEADFLEIQKTKDLSSYSDEQSSEEKAARDYREALQDDGWEFFDNSEIYA